MIKDRKKRNIRKRTYSPRIALFLCCSLVLTVPGCNLHGFAVQAETGRIAHAEEGFSYRLYYEPAVSTTGPGRRGAGEQSLKAEITAYSGTDTEITIPGIIDGKEVKSIGRGAFKGNAEITRVTIAEGITSIGYEAFSGCENLAAVSIPSTVTSWSDTSGNNYESLAFQNCTALTELTLAEGLKSLGQKAFMDCSALERVTVPSTIEKFRDRVFAGCTSLRELELKEGIREIGYHAFEGCTSLEEVAIPSTVERWGTLTASGIAVALYECAPFRDCTALKKVTFAEGLKTLAGFQGVAGCPLVEELDIPASVTNIARAFTDCSDLKQVTMREGMGEIGESAFEGCASLTRVRIPFTVEKVCANAFKGCSALERLVFPPGVTSLEGGITEGCDSLQEIYLLAPAVKWYQALPFPLSGKLYCLEGSSTYGTYQAGLPEASKQKLTPVVNAGVQGEGHQGVYDGMAHPAVSLQGTQAGDDILYCVSGGDYLREVPEITEPGIYGVEIYVLRSGEDGPLAYSRLGVQAEIGKRQHAMHLADVEAEEGQEYLVSAEGYEGTGEVVYTYYLDEACSQACAGKPRDAGVYYVRGEADETEHDAAARSNVAKITIREKVKPSMPPSASQNPGTSPEVSQSPGLNPGVTPSASPNSGANATASPRPGTSVSPGPQTGASPSPVPNPGTTKIPEASGKPGVKPKQTAKPGGIAKPKVGRVTLKKVKATKKRALQVQWKKVSKASGYQVQIGMSQKFAKGKKSYLVNQGKTTKKTIKKLWKKKYYVRVRAYRKWQGKRCYGKWSKVKGVKVR